MILKTDNTRKLIFFDIDGTLITEGSDHYVPESTKKALHILRQNGHICIINTGRPYSALDDVIMSIESDGYVCGCGTYIRLGDEILKAQHLDRELCGDIIRELENCRMEWLLEGEDAMYYSPEEYRTRMRRDVGSLKTKLPEKMRCLDTAASKDISFDKFCMVCREESDRKRFFSLFSGRLTFIDRGEDFFEVIPCDCSKASGMRFLEEYLGISHENTIAVGDSTNDIPMLEYARTAVVMGNAPEALHSYADFVTDDVESDGIYNAFRHYGLI